MAVQNPFFGRREPEPFQPPRPGGAGMAQPGGLTGNATGTSGMAPVSASSATPPQQPSQADTGGSKLTVGPNIKLKGVEITDCDTLVVEGTVEATMDSRVIQIAQQGAFRGSADIDIAEIRGEFNGTLNVREKLVIFSTGKVTGKIRYGKLVVEEGGQLSGEVEMGVGKGPSHAAQTTPSAISSSSSTPVPAAAQEIPAAAPQAEPGADDTDNSTASSGKSGAAATV